MPIDNTHSVWYNPTVLIHIIQLIQLSKGGLNLSLITVDLRDRKQLYEQIIDNIKNLILTGEFKVDDRLPSVRALAKELGINPNTIQKAYSELERQGIIMTLPGRGSIILSDKNSLRGEKLDDLTEKLTSIAFEMQTSGVSEEEFIEIARSAYKKAGANL